ncbi:unnamed protein product [Ambrosiozyma monospora]|uniref:Unnamed protein product n=1 Tax=Ambrosiozyma monospora TaxID=43982 RepID=A0ACB5SVA1_AMBMO|nr:unnamed protein product [Ambrosiozyma monospora]
MSLSEEVDTKLKLILESGRRAMLETSEYLKDWYVRTLIEDLTLLELGPMDRLYSTKYDFEHMTEKETKLFFRFSDKIDSHAY